MDQIMVKTEVQSNGEILLYYVDENGHSQEGVLTTVENIERDPEPIQDQDSSYIFEESYEDLVDDPPLLEEQMEEVPEPWSDEDTKRLLIFFNDNKTTFISGTTQKRHLWAVACKTMLIGKEYLSCEEKLADLRTKYCEIRGYIKKGIYVKWPFLDLCHQAFHDDDSVIASLNDEIIEIEEEIPEPKVAVIQSEKFNEQEGILAVKQVNTKSPDEQVKKMLNLYLKYKQSFQKEHWRRDLWEKIAEEMDEADSEYLQKRFLNYKQHYVTLLSKKKEQGTASVSWPYMEIFDKIFSDDISFHKKYFNTGPETKVERSTPEHEWSETQKLILVKYYFDCYDEYEDPTIPDKFLWTEVGRLVDKKPETCKIRYEMLRKEHLEKYISGDYDIQGRKAISIIFDNIIPKDVKTKLSKMKLIGNSKETWKTDELDELVQFFFDNIEIFKDRDCHFVCWSAVAYKLKRSLVSCKQQWDELTVLYKSILDCKKEDPDTQIDWRYIEMFDRIFDYGMDADLLKGYNTNLPQSQKPAEKVVVKKVNIKLDKKQDKDVKPAFKSDPNISEDITEPRTDPRSTKILEYYLKYKSKFVRVNDKVALWDPLAKQIGMNSTQCAHRFRNLKQTYLDYIKKEIDRPRIPITWPYFALCKKVFGYRTHKNNLKQGQIDTDNDNWLTGEIRKLITYFSKNFNEISNNVEDLSKWSPIAKELGKSATSCKDKFLELRKCYRKLRTMRARNPDVNISWSYFNMFERIYDIMAVDDMEEEHLEMEGVTEEGADDDYECIIVLKDGQDLEDLHEIPLSMDSSELIKEIPDIPQEEKTSCFVSKTPKWTKRLKKRLLIFYINYIRSHKGKEIEPKAMWAEIANKLSNKSPVKCRKMLAKMKNSYKQADETVKKNSPFSYLLEKVFKLKPIFVTTERKLQEKTYKNVSMPSEKVNLALQYYLEHIDEFVNPKFEKKYLWTQLANYISEPVRKVYNKINYLKQAYNILTEEISGEKTEFSALLKDIIAKEVAVEIVLDVPNSDLNDNEINWTDGEIEQLLLWYLCNLDKFKNPKFNRSYLWIEASNFLGKSPLVCSRKMSEIRTQYRNMVKQNAEGISDWRFLALCQKIYGTGKKSNTS